MKILVGIILLAVCMSSYFLKGWLSPPLPTDEELTARFFKERDSFDELGRLFIDDTTLIFASDGNLHRLVGPGSVLVSDPTENYKSAFERTGILYGGRDGVLHLDFIEFTSFRRKLDGGDFSQQSYEETGYVLMLSSPKKVEGTLGSANEYGNMKLKQIEGQWYIFHGIRVSKPE